jgi:DNA-damage-inducible protein J
MANITIRVDNDIKRDAEVLFSKLGLSMSGAINIFFRQAVREQAIPFQIKANTKDEYFNEHNMKILEESIAQAKAGNIVVKTMSELEAMANE